MILLVQTNGENFIFTFENDHIGRAQVIGVATAYVVENDINFDSHDLECVKNQLAMMAAAECEEMMFIPDGDKTNLFACVVVSMLAGVVWGLLLQ